MKIIRLDQSKKSMRSCDCTSNAIGENNQTRRIKEEYGGHVTVRAMRLVKISSIDESELKVCDPTCIASPKPIGWTTGRRGREQ